MIYYMNDMYQYRVVSPYSDYDNNRNLCIRLIYNRVDWEISSHTTIQNWIYFAAVVVAVMVAVVYDDVIV
jgi:hypothetical protein